MSRHTDTSVMTVSTQPIPRAVMLAAGADQRVPRALVRPFDSVAYVYARLDVLGEDERDLRWRTLARSLRDDGAPEEAVAVLGAHLALTQPAPATLAAFAAADGSLLHDERITDHGLTDQAGFAAPAKVVPLLAWAQGRPPYVLVVIDRTGADLTSCPGGDERAHTWSVEGPDDEIERNAPGGWSQPRYQSRAEDSWRNNAERVAEAVVDAVGDVDAQVLVVSGDLRAVQLLTERLPDDPTLLVAFLAGSRAPDGSQAGRANHVEQLLREAAETQTHRLLDYFHAQLWSGGFAVEGRAATIDALAEGRVATLFITDADDDTSTWFGPAATDIYRSHAAAEMSRKPVRCGPLADVAVRSALMADSRVRVIPVGTPGAPVNGIGALCRYGLR
jgi:hypothetical protein